MVARISNDYRPQLPVVGKDIPGPAVPYHVRTARLLETVNNRTRSVGRAVQVSLRNDWLTQMADDSCGEGCAQLDDFKWFLPADERAGDLTAPESEIEVSDSESEVEYIEPDSTPLQTEMTAQQLLCPPVVAQMRPMEGCNPALPRRLRRGRDVLTEDGVVAVDTRQVSAASDTVVSRKIHRKSECVLTVVPKLAATPQAASEVVQPRPRDYGCTDLLPPVGECLESLGIDTPDAGESGMEVASGSPLAVMDISLVPDVLPTSVSVTAVVSEEWMERFFINLDVLCLDGLASAEDPAEEVRMSAVKFAWFRIRYQQRYPYGQ